MNLIPALDLFPLLASILVLVGCTLLGNFLVREAVLLSIF